MKKLLSFNILLALVSVSLLSLPGCTAFDKMKKFSWFSDASEPAKAADYLAMEGVEYFNHGDYHAALEAFEAIKNQYPFGQYSLLAELKAADCNYYLEQYPEAMALYEEFETNHPTNEAAPYVIFQIGKCHYRQIDTIDRDPQGAVAAIQAFERLIRSYPDSPYTKEAKVHTENARNFLAGHEMYVAVFYMRTGSLKQAESRLEGLLKDYPDSIVQPKATELLAAIKSGNPPKRTWRSWLPDVSLPDITELSTMRPGAGTGQ